MKRILLTAAGIGFATLAYAETAPSDVQYGEYGQVVESITGTPGDPAAGLTIMVDRGKGNCIACHVGPGAVATLRVEHSSRGNCRQCHVPDMDTEPFQRKPRS